MKDITMAYVLWGLCFFGLFGIHRFYLNSWGMGFVYLLTFGLCGFGQIFDVLLIPSMISEANGTSTASSGAAGNSNVGLFGFGNMLGGNYIAFNNAQPYAPSSSGNPSGYSQYYVNNGDGQEPQSYVPPQQTTGEGENNEYVPPQQFGFTMYINGQPVDLSNGGTIYMDDSGAAQYYTNDDEDDYRDSMHDTIRRLDEDKKRRDQIFESTRRMNETIQRSNHINQENTRRMNENIRRNNEQQHRINESNMRTHTQNMNRMHETMRNNQTMHNNNMQRMHQQNMMNNMNRMHRR